MAAVDIPLQRRYHDTSSAYVLPNDAIEQTRLDAQAAAIVEMIGGVTCLAPLRSMPTVSKAVDVGCGTGVATIQIAEMFPSAKVYGLDLSPVPESVQKMAPSNVSWAVGNILDVGDDRNDDDKTNDDSSNTVSNDSVISREIFAGGGLDYLFGRMLFLGINDWSKYFSTAARSLSSGGIIEHQDLDWKFYRVGTSDCLSDGWEWHRRVVAAAEGSGLSTRAGSDAARHMKNAGLEISSVQTFEFSFVPSEKTPSSQAMGRYVQAKLLPQYPELLRKMLGSQGVEGEELDRLIKNSLADITSEEGVHQKYTVTVGRKQ